MKSVAILIAALMMATGLATAQDTPVTATDVTSTIELLRSDLKTGRKALLTEAMQFTEKEADAFWPIYNEYELERSKMGDRYLQSLKEYAANYDTMTNEMAEKLMKKVFVWQKDNVSLIEKYYKKVAKAITAKRAARFVQMENRINQLVLLQLASEIPLAK